MVYPIRKPLGQQPYLAAVNISADKLSSVCIKLGKVISLASRQSVNIVCEGNTFNDVPVWIHTDVGARYSYYKSMMTGGNEEFPNPADYFKDSAFLFPTAGCTPDGTWGTFTTNFSLTEDEDVIFPVASFTLKTKTLRTFNANIISSIDDELGFVSPSSLSVVLDGEGNISSVTVSGVLLNEDEYVYFDVNTVAIHISYLTHLGDNCIIPAECVKAMNGTSVTLCNSVVGIYRSMKTAGVIDGVVIAKNSSKHHRVHVMIGKNKDTGLDEAIGVIGMESSLSQSEANPTYRPYFQFTTSGVGITTRYYLYDLVEDKVAEVPTIGVGGVITGPYLEIDGVTSVSDPEKVTAMNAFIAKSIKPGNQLKYSTGNIFPVGTRYSAQMLFYMNYYECGTDPDCSYSHNEDGPTCDYSESTYKSSTSGQRYSLGDLLPTGKYDTAIEDRYGSYSMSHTYSFTCNGEYVSFDHDVATADESGSWSAGDGSMSYSFTERTPVPWQRVGEPPDQYLLGHQVLASSFSMSLDEVSVFMDGSSYRYTTNEGVVAYGQLIYTYTMGNTAEYKGIKLSTADFNEKTGSYYLRFNDGSFVRVKSGVVTSYSYSAESAITGPSAGYSFTHVQSSSTLTINVSITEKDESNHSGSYGAVGSSSYSYDSNTSGTTTDEDYELHFSRSQVKGTIIGYKYPNLICSPIGQGLVFMKLNSTGYSHNYPYPVESPLSAAGFEVVGYGEYDDNVLIKTGGLVAYMENAISDLINNVLSGKTVEDITITTQLHLVPASVKELYLRETV